MRSGRDADCADESCLDGVCDGSCGVTPCCDAPGDEEDSMMSVGAGMAAVAMARMPNEDLARKAALGTDPLRAEAVRRHRAGAAGG